MTEQGLVVAYLLDGKGGGRRLSWEEIDAWRPEHGVLWVHLARDPDDSRDWLRNRSGLDPLVVEALLAESTRPRTAQVGDGALLFLRGVNLNPGADPEDMVSIRMWLDAKRIVSVRLRRLMSIDDMCEAIDGGRGPHAVGDFIPMIADLLANRMAGVIAEIEDQVDSLQDSVLVAETRQQRSELNRLRREIIALRRYLAPQRDALSRLLNLKVSWISERDQLHVREEADRVARYVEDLDAARERAAVTQEELGNRLAEQMNTRMYVLSMVAAIFLPLGFLTGLFGINVGGIPLAEDPRGFVDIVLLLLLMTGLQVVLFRWRRWF